MVGMNLRNEVISKIKEMLTEDIELEVIDVIKLNDMHLHGIVFQKGDFGATFYLEDFNDGNKSSREIAEEMLTAYETSPDAPPIEMMDSIKDMQKLENVQNHLIVTLADIGKNHDFLKTVPFKEIGNGIAFICRAFHAEDNDLGVMCTTITNDVVKANGWNVDEMFDCAIKNTMKVNPPRLYKMANALFGQPVDDLFANDIHIESEDMLVLTNGNGMYGAASLFLPGITNKLIERIGQPFFAIPSSQHEYILIPESSGFTMVALKAMCKEANETVVALKDVLSDNVLYISDKEVVH